MLARRLQAHEVDDVHDAHPEVREASPQHAHGGQRLERRNVAGAGHDDVGILVALAGCPVPHAEPARAVVGSRLDRQPGGRRLLAGHDDVDVVAAAQAVIGDGEQGVRVGRQVDADHLGLLVHHVVDEAGILMRETVVILAPHVRGEQVVERRDGLTPRDAAGDLEPFRVLVEHRVDDVDERLVAREHAVAAGEEVALEPPLADVLGEDLHHAPVGRETLVER